jgi:phage tail protein X
MGYLEDKMQQLNATGYQGKSNWTVADVTKGLSDAGLTPEAHYEAYGKAEGIRAPGSSAYTAANTNNIANTYLAPVAPNSSFDASAYMQNKANQLNQNAQYGITNWTPEMVAKGFAAAGLTPAEHSKLYGTGENIYGYTVKPQTYQSGLATSSYGTEYVNPLSLASNQAANILKEGSPLLTQAQGYGNQIANGRNLQNSTIGAEIGTSAVTKVAADLGKANAVPYMSAQQAAQQGDIQSSLSSQGYNQTSALSDQSYNQNTAIAELQNGFATQLAQMGFDEAKTLALTNMVGSSNNILMNQIGSLLNNTDIEMSDNVVGWMTGFQEASWRSAARLLGIQIDVS